MAELEQSIENFSGGTPEWEENVSEVKTRQDNDIAENIGAYVEEFELKQWKKLSGT